MLNVGSGVLSGETGWCKSKMTFNVRIIHTGPLINGIIKQTCSVQVLQLLKKFTTIFWLFNIRTAYNVIQRQSYVVNAPFTSDSPRIHTQNCV